MREEKELKRNEKLPAHRLKRSTRVLMEIGKERGGPTGSGQEAKERTEFVLEGTVFSRNLVQRRKRSWESEHDHAERVKTQWVETTDETRSLERSQRHRLWN